MMTRLQVGGDGRRLLKLLPPPPSRSLLLLLMKMAMIMTMVMRIQSREGKRLVVAIAPGVNY